MVDPETIYNWRRLDDRITTSGQPTEQQLAAIRALGVRHIVNLGLHTHEKALPDEAASLARLGMTYIHIPVNFQNPTDQETQARAEMEAVWQPNAIWTAFVARRSERRDR